MGWISGMSGRVICATGSLHSQRGMLFSGHREQPALCDENATAEELNKAVEIAQAAEFINTSPNGMDTEIAQGAATCLGAKAAPGDCTCSGQETPIYIFDDCLRHWISRPTCITQALKKETNKYHDYRYQRVATIKNAEQIIVLNDGEIVGKGKHEELLATCETYREIALSQLSAKELAQS